MAKKEVKPVKKPYLTGSWSGKSVRKKGYKMILSILFISFLYLILGVMLSFDAYVLRVITSVIVIAFAAMYMYFQGANSGESDTAFGEIMYQHKLDGKSVDSNDFERCFHPAKGFYMVGIALIPYVLITLVFAVLTKPITYSLGVLPSWIEWPALQTHANEALAYYNQQNTSQVIAILRIITRALTMPFVNIALPLGNMAVFWVERLSPLCVILAPLAYGIGYMQGPKIRSKINTGIEIGLRKKKRKERKERKARMASKKPEQLI